ncbi:MAG TPA: Wzz/FepE/Etk N-terminal domain-containing protein, partial [Taishania sp.]|nr:Wzz/FepE/Etk N-terminal domain-containing protein [Taishania sp.]
MAEKEITVKDLVFQIKEICNYLVFKWKIILAVVLVGAILGLLISLRSKTSYTASLTFIVEEESKAGGGLAGLAMSFGFGTAGGGSLFASSNLVELLKTRTMVEEALLSPVREKEYSSKTYAELYIDTYELREDWNEDPKLKNIRFEVGEDRSKYSREKDSILGTIYTNLIKKSELIVPEPNSKNSLLLIKVNSESEVFSKNFPLELMDVASEYYLKSKTEKTQNSVNMLEYQVDSVRSVLFNSMSGAASASDNVFGLNPAMNVQRVASSKHQAQAQMSMVVLQELVKNLEVAKMKLLDETPVITVIDKPIYPLERERLGKGKGIILGGFVSGFLIV